MHAPQRTRLAVAGLVAAGLMTSALGLAAFGAHASPAPAHADRDAGPAPASQPERVPVVDKGDRRKKETRRDHPELRDLWFYTARTAGTNPSFDILSAATARRRAAEAVLAMRAQPHTLAASPAAFDGAWRNVGPDPMASTSRAYSGRVQALAVRSSPPYTIYLGAAQGGVWVSSTLTAGWLPLSNQLPTQAIGDIALAPSNENIVYVGTGEGALSGDSYFGDGVYRSDDGGRSFRRVSGEAIVQSSVSKVVVDPTDPDHVYIATIRGVSGNRAVGGPGASPFGVWESRDGGASWLPRLTTTERLRGATDLVMDPQDPRTLLASFWMQGIVKTTDGGQTWRSAMTGLPANADWGSQSARSRIALGISRPDPARPAVVYAGFNWTTTAGQAQPSTVWRSADAGETWAETSRQVVAGYCGGQCWYDNMILADPTNPDIVYALGVWNYGTSSGGVFRSMDGGRTWLDLGYGQHPDYHAAAVRRDRPEYLVVGNDGGVWSSTSRGGRLAGEPYTRTQWVNLNGRASSTAVDGTGLMTAQYVGIAQHPSNPGLIYGGTQDNGTHRRLAPSNAFRIIQGGDGGQALVDPYEPRYVYGTYYNLSPYRFTDGASGGPGPDITTGIDTNDRSAFYVPFAMDPEQTHRLYIGSYRLYRTDNRGDQWQAISADLTSGCTSSAASPTGYGCVITAIGPQPGSGAVYVGTGDARLWLSTDATVAQPRWARVDKAPLPVRPVTSFAVDRSDYRRAYVAFGGFNGATPTQPGHVFATADGGRTWTDISANLPDAPVNSVVLDASEPDTLYVGTDVGPLVTRDRGRSWEPLGSGFPIVGVWQLSLNPYTRQIAAGTHGRGIWTLTDDARRLPALQVRAFDGGLPVGPGRLLTLTLQVRNVGNAPATGLSIRNPLPDKTSFVDASDGGAVAGREVVWSGGTVPVSGTLSVHFTVRLNNEGLAEGDVIINDGLRVTAAEGVATAGSPLAVTVAPPFAASLTPAAQLDGTRSGGAITYTLTVENRGFTPSAFALSVPTHTWATTLWDAAFRQPLARTPTVAPGERFTFGLRVAVPPDAADEARDTATIAVSPVGAPTVQALATVTTLGVVDQVLLMDASTGDPNVQAQYADAVRAAGHRYDLWVAETAGPLPERYLAAHPLTVWWTGAAYPAPLIPYEPMLARYLDGGGRLFLSGMDLLDQAAGTTDFVRRYLHVDWDGSDRQNDIGTKSVTAVATNTVTAGLGELGLDVAALYDQDFSNQITPIAPAVAAFRDDKGQPNSLTVEAGAYRVMFLAWPFEALVGARPRDDLMARALGWFGLDRRFVIQLPLSLNRPRTSPW